MNQNITIRLAGSKDKEAIEHIIKSVLAIGDAYVFTPNLPNENMMDYWFRQDGYTYVALLQNRVVGTFILKDNFPEMGSTVMNVSYLTDPTELNKGIEKAMGTFSIEEAKAIGYYSIQLNLIVKREEPPLELWRNLGFQIIHHDPSFLEPSEEGDPYTLIVMGQRIENV